MALVVVLIGKWLLWPTPNKLVAAAERGDMLAVRWFLLLGGDPDAPRKWGWHGHADGDTPLTAAAGKGHLEVIRILLDHGANKNLPAGGPTYPGLTPLATAACMGKLEVCQLLLEAGAMPNTLSNLHIPGNPGKWTPLDWALQAEHHQVVELLKQHGGRESGFRIIEAK